MMKKKINYIPSNILFLCRTYLLSIGLFAFFRLILLFIEWEQTSQIPFITLLKSFLVGWRFDTSITGYLLILPFIITTVLNFINPKKKKLKLIAFYYFALFYFGVIVLLSIDLPYYNFFNTRLTSGFFQWLATPSIVFGFLLESPEYYPFILLLLGIYGLFLYMINKLIKVWANEHIREFEEKKKFRPLYYPLLYIVFILLMFLGIRGRVDTYPINWGIAYFSPYPFANSLALNPIFTFGRSIVDKAKYNAYDYDYIDNETALKNIKMYYNVKESGYDSPLARLVNPEGEEKRYNVVVIIMESMAEAFTGSSGLYNPTLTPFLDSLKKKSIYFSNMYSAGTHSYNGLEALFLSIPSMPEDKRSAFNLNKMQNFAGMGTTLFKKGYQTFFICAHDDQFDNVQGLMANNGFEKIISMNDFKKEELVSTWGIPDHRLYDNALEKIDKANRKDKPFFCAMFNVSNHSPYIIPEDALKQFTPNHKDDKVRSVEYADWSLKYFFEQAQQKPWFDSTIFVLIADHGENLFPFYEINLLYTHIPLLIYAPKIFEQQQIDKLAMQIDVYPTLMHLLNAKYVNNTFGIDLFDEERPFVLCNADFKLGALNDSLFLVTIKDQSSVLYKYQEHTLNNYAQEYPKSVEIMETYIKSHLQVLKWMVTNHKVKYIEQ